MKKTVIILVGVAVLAAGGYAAGQMLTKKKNNDKFVQLEDGRKMRISGEVTERGKFNRDDERPDVVGKIKSIDDDQMVVEKFEMPSGGASRGAGAIQDGEMPTERPEPTVAGEETISLSDSTSYVKGPERGMGRRRESKGDDNLEDISKNDLSEGSMVSIWLSDDSNVAERVMMR